jgi:arginyl-tRNA synthetase
LNGHTGPFIQYAYARIQSLLSKAGSFEFDATATMNDSEKEVVKQLALYPAIIQDAANNFSPAIIANYTYELVKLYNQFYQSIYILQEEDAAIKSLRLTLSESVANVISSSMSLLGINVPKRM